MSEVRFQVFDGKKESEGWSFTFRLIMPFPLPDAMNLIKTTNVRFLPSVGPMKSAESINEWRIQTNFQEKKDAVEDLRKFIENLIDDLKKKFE